MVVQYVDLKSELQTSLLHAKRGLERKSFCETSYRIDKGNEKLHPDDDIMMSYAAKALLEGVKDAGGIPIIPPIGDQENGLPLHQYD